MALSWKAIDTWNLGPAKKLIIEAAKVPGGTLYRSMIVEGTKTSTFSEISLTFAPDQPTVTK